MMGTKAAGGTQAGAPFTYWFLILASCGLLATTPARGQAPTQFKVVKAGGFSPVTDSLLTQALLLLNQHFFSPEFEQEIIKARMKITLGLTPAQIRARITAPDAGNSILMRLEVYPAYAGGDEVGVTISNPDGSHLTRTYEGYILEHGAKCYAAHLAHEYCHWVGFWHPRFKFLGNRKRLSVPYVIGDLLAARLGADCP